MQKVKVTGENQSRSSPRGGVATLKDIKDGGPSSLVQSFDVVNSDIFQR